jgi:hypothetical protein
LFLASSLCNNGHVNGRCIKCLINYRNTIHSYQYFYFHVRTRFCVGVVWSGKGAILKIYVYYSGVLQESTLYLVQLSQLITLHCLIIFYLSESCQYYSVFHLMYCLKNLLACHFCSLHFEQHNNISPTIKLCGEEPPSESGSQLVCSLPLWNLGFFVMFTGACHWCCLDPVQTPMFFKIHFNVILSAARSRRMVYYPHILWLHSCVHISYPHVC